MEQHRQQVVRAGRARAAGGQRIGQPRIVVRAQLVDAFMQPDERPAVRRQHQRVGRQRAQALERRQVHRQRVRLGFGVVDADVGADARQHHVAGDQHAERRAVQRDVLGRVPVAGDAAPVVVADAQRQAVDQPAVLRRHRRHQARVVAGARTHLRHRVGVDQPMRGEERRRAVTAEAGGRLAADARRVVVGRADPQPRTPALGQPVRQPDVVGVHVRDDHAQHRQRVEPLREHTLPGVARRVAGDAAVDDGPAFAAVVGAVAQQPEVDVVERERQPHAHPTQPRRDLEHRAGRRHRVGQRVVQPVLVGVGHRGLLYIDVNVNRV